MDSISAHYRACIAKLAKDKRIEEFCKCICAPVTHMNDKACLDGCEKCMIQAPIRDPCECLCNELGEGGVASKEKCRKTCRENRGKTCATYAPFLPTCDELKQDGFNASLNDVIWPGSKRDKGPNAAHDCLGGWHYRFRCAGNIFTVLCCPCCRLSKKAKKPSIIQQCKNTG